MADTLRPRTDAEWRKLLIDTITEASRDLFPLKGVLAADMAMTKLNRVLEWDLRDFEQNGSRVETVRS